MNGLAALRSVLAANPEAVVTAVGPNGRLIEVPDGVIDSHRRFSGTSGIDLVIAEDQFAVLDAWARAQEQPVVEIEVHLLADPDRTATVHIFDVRDEHGVHILVLEGQGIEAVLESVDARAARREEVARVTKDAFSVFLEVDDATTSILGWSAAELVGHPTVEFVHPDDVERAIDGWVEMRDGHGTNRVHLRMRHADGHYVWLEVTNENRLDDPEHACVISEMVDVSDEMAQLEALRDRERLLARLAEALPIGICHLRVDREVVYCNELLEAMLGPIDSIDALIRSVGQRDRAAFAAAIDQAFVGRSGFVEVSLGDAVGERRCELNVRAMTSDGGDVDGVIVCCADVTDRSRLRAELEHRASHDALTGCLNRVATTAAAERLLREGRSVAIAFIDLDGFKSINDEFGHAAGDEVLRVAAARLRGATRSEDVVGRLGGDEFVVILSVDAEVDPDALEGRLTDAIDGDVMFAKQRIPLRASVGAAMSTTGELDAEALLQRADAAMYRTKRAGARRWAGGVLEPVPPRSADQALSRAQ